MSVIRVLTEKVASQIAAGEVIERPASIVRELIDNSIDAGSDRISLKIEKGGKTLIRVSDNGIGMNRDDLFLCVERHATSKIHGISDLTSIRTLGFRGEAIPSMCAVSRTEITSRPADQLIGFRLKVAGGKLKSIEETGSPAGTIVEVRDLFFNTPARRKFLRTVKTENDHILDTLTRIALPFTRIHFKLDDAGKTLLNLPSSESAIDRLSQLLGREVAASMTETDKETGGMGLKAYLAPPDSSRNRGDRIFVYVNNRHVRDRLITRAVMEGYGQRLMKGRYPYAVIFIEIDPSLVDVNVHPTKQEVRFHQSHLVYQTIVSAIEGSLGQRHSSIFEPKYPRPRGGDTEHGYGTPMAEPAWVYSDAHPAGDAHVVEPRFEQKDLLKEVPQVLGQLKETYILCQSRDGLLMVDQHAAHERIVYETLKKCHQGSNIERQAFLIPQKIELSLKEARILQEHLNQLADIGLDIEHFGGNTFLLRSVPVILVDVHWENFLRDLIPVLEEGDVSSEKVLDGLLTLISCHGALRAGQRLSQKEMSLLLSQLEEMNLSTNCPHGRPIIKTFSYYEIEKMFKRIV